MSKVLIGVKDGKIVSGSSLDMARISLAEDLVYLSEQPDISIYVVDGPITIGTSFIAARDKWWIAKIQKEFHSELRNSMECTTNHCEKTIDTDECYKTMCLFYRWEKLKKSLEE